MIRLIFSKPYILRLAWRELRNERGFSSLFIANMIVGLLGLVAVSALKGSISSSLMERSKAILAADLAVSANRALTPEELQRLDAEIPAKGLLARGHEISFMSMAVAKSSSRLAEIRAVDRTFPMYGALELGSGSRVEGRVSGSKESEAKNTSNNLDTEPIAWVYPELLVQLNVKIGDNIQIGDQVFRIADTVKNDASMSSVSFAVAPKIFIGFSYAEKTGLLARGSRIFYSHLYKFPPEKDADEFVQRLKKVLDGTKEIKIRSHKSASEELGRLTQYMNDYLGLVGLVALFLASVGSNFLFRSFLQRRAREIAILISLGAGYRQARAVYVVQIVVLGFIASLGALLIAAAMLPLSQSILAPFVGDGVAVNLQPESILLALVVGTFASVMFCWPLLARFGEMRAAALFQENVSPQIQFRRGDWLNYAPSVILYALLAIMQCKSIKVGLIFVGGFLGASVVMFGLGQLGLKTLSLGLREFSRFRTFGWESRLALKNLTRDQLSTLSSFVAVGLGAVLLNVVPQLRIMITKELSTGEGATLPAFFLFDIQDEQVPTLENLLSKRDVRLAFLSPMVRARLDGINTKSLEDGFDNLPGTRERQEEERFRSRMFNLSSREKLGDAEELISGTWFSGRFSWDEKKPAEVSLEQRFAERLGVKLGDHMKFDIQGVELDTVVTSMRRVRWASFQPNFFVQVQPGALDDAPKTWVAAVPERKNLDKNGLQMEIVKESSNISVVDVTQSVQRILGIVDRMVDAVNFMSACVMFAGLTVLFSIANFQALRKRRETALLKAIGSDFAAIRKVNQVEFLTIGLGAGFLAGGLGIGFTALLAAFVFETVWTPNFIIPVIVSTGAALLTVGAGMFAVRGALRASPSELL